jgi:hypothetical protein
VNTIRALSHFAIWTVAAAVVSLSVARAHPVAQGSVEIQILPDAVAVHFRISNEQIFVAESIGPKAKPAASLEELWERHANYVREHFVLLLDGTPRAGKLITLTPPSDRSVKGFTGYLFQFPAEKITRLELQETMLREIEFAPGNPWEATFTARVVRGESVIREAAILTAKQPLVANLLGVASAFKTTTAPRVAPITRDYFVYGIQHIAAGWDHILFVVALVLAVPRLWPVLALVTVFTVAHTITLSLAVLRLVSAPSGLVEPMIACSIVVAAALNLFRTSNPPLAPRLFVAFGFGLFHGLGFASGLIAAMEGYRASTLAAAIAGFSIGVEAGHQLVVVPFVLLLWTLRRYAAAFVPAVTRAATIAVLIAGLWLLSYSIRPALPAASMHSESLKS